jgi:hypothetical protein
MLRKALSTGIVVRAIMCIQVLPLLLFPTSSYSPKTQEWWLPVFLTVLVILSIIQLLFRKSSASWPWYLISFSQGFNIISRLMMLMPHATVIRNGALTFNTVYVVLAAVSMILSAFVIWYQDLPEVRNRLLV